jgi:RsiW-degrading membrane proteinase PrsW (M82 family)
MIWRLYNDIPLPAMILAGSFAAPIATLALLFRLASPEKVSLSRLAVMLTLGSVVSFIVSMAAYYVTAPGRLGGVAAGVIEEPAKLVALVLLSRDRRCRGVRDGLLLGAAIGAGFAALENAGYTLQSEAGHGASAMMRSAVLRGFLSPATHIAWTGMAGAALWRVTADRPLRIKMLVKPGFFLVALLAVVLHTLWNLGDGSLLPLKIATLGPVAWFVIWALVQQGRR